MRNFKSIFLLLPISLLATTLVGCNNKKNVRVIRVLNCEDYIYEYEEGDEEYAVEGENYFKESMMKQFVKYWAKTHNEEKIDYVYDTFDTNETMFNELKTGKTTYDVIVPSDYMIQKLITENMLHKISPEYQEGGEKNVWTNISGYLKDQFDTITAKYKEESYKLSDYAVPYMWGTVGLMYSPKYYMENNKDLTIDDVHALFEDWDNLYVDDNIIGSYSIKDSVRDTYAVSLVHTYRDDIDGTYNKETGVTDTTKLKEIFNRCSEKEMGEVKEDMLELKKHAFGFECDSGKTDMVDEKIGANMCWSGDATWAITEARDDDPKENLDLYYSIPTKNKGKMSASNIWFDGLCMPKNTDHEDNLTDEEKAQYELAEEFIRFMSMPEIAVQNCYCVGYTPGVAGDAILDYMKDCYESDSEDAVPYDLTYFFDYESYKNGVSTVVLSVDPDMAKRELAAQYPEQGILERLAVMRDFGPKANAKLLDMWEQVRTNNLPVWAIIILVVEALGGIAFAAYLIRHKVNRKRFKKERHS